jgi:hypothetical protein
MGNKSPAFNFYSGDFLNGVLFMGDADIGKYIKLMCVQHQKGHMTLEQMEHVCRGPVPPAVMEKFTHDNEGLYYNLRLEDVVHKKTAVVDVLKGNLGKWAGKSRAEIAKMKAEERETAEFPEKEGTEAHSTQNAEVIPKETEPPAGRFKPPTVEEVAEYCKERNNKVDVFDFVNFYESKGWMVGKNKMKDWKASVRHWESDKKEFTSKGIDRGQRPGQIIVDGSVPASFTRKPMMP